MTPIEDVLAQIPAWQGRSLTVAPLPGGLSNINYRVDLDDTSYVVRIPGQNTALLGIDAQHSHLNTLLAAQTGVGAQLLYYLPQLSVMVLEFIAGPTMDSASLQEPRMIPRIAHSVRMLHTGPPFANTFNLFRTMDAYLHTVRRTGIPIPDGYDAALAIARRIEDAMQVSPLPPVPCHNDLMPENFIDDGALLRLVDYDYSGANDPCCDLGYICNEAEFSPDQTLQMCAAYFGQLQRNMVARVWLYRCMTNLVSTLWGAIQQNVSEIEYDFWDLALVRWRRAQLLIDSPEFSTWLHDVRKPHGQ